jgi:hypothetical protein
MDVKVKTVKVPEVTKAIREIKAKIKQLSEDQGKSRKCFRECVKLHAKGSVSGCPTSWKDRSAEITALLVVYNQLRETGRNHFKKFFEKKCYFYGSQANQNRLWAQKKVWDNLDFGVVMPYLDEDDKIMFQAQIDYNNRQKENKRIMDSLKAKEEVLNKETRRRLYERLKQEFETEECEEGGLMP